MPHLSYNNLEVVAVAVQKEHLKALIDRLNQEQLQALWVILNSMTWPKDELALKAFEESLEEEELSPEEEACLLESEKQIRKGMGIKASDVWDENGI
ncbi:MAG: hypothetical protein VR67_17660 [Peptococcaceae bacterium BRH_c8a]|nr:MAG: hypothetical protein VR67_17660 [Peptococcaceae bacterium BRH_c8a]